MIFRNLGVFGGKRSGLGVFAPSNIAGLQLWLDATDATTLNAKMAADFVSANTEYLSSASADFDKGNESFSFGGWFKPDVVGGATSKYYMGKMSSSSGNYSFSFFENAANVLAFGLSNNGSAFIQTNTVYSPTTDWQFFVMVYDAENDLQKISINGGAFVTGANSTGAFSSSTADLTINGTTTGTSLFDGKSDSCFFYNKALTQDQVTALYNSGNGTAYDNLTTDMLTSLVSWWELNEQSGTRFDAHASNDLTDNNTVGYALGKVQEPISANDYVWRWTDKSTNVYNFDQNTAASQPQYVSTGFGTKSKPYLRFDGVDDFLQNTGVSALSQATIFFVWRDDNDSGIRYYFSFGQTSTANQHVSLATSTNTLYSFTGTVTINGDTITTNTNYLSSLRIESDGTFTRILNGNSETLSANYGSPVNINGNFDIGRYVGTTFPSKAYIAEMVIYNEALTDAQVTQLTNYLNTKYGIY